MIKDDIQELLQKLEFEYEGNIYTKRYPSVNEPLKVDISGDGHIYYSECGITIGRETPGGPAFCFRQVSPTK